MSVKCLKTLLLLTATFLYLFVVGSVSCKDSELFEVLEGREISLGEKIRSFAEKTVPDWDNLLQANLNGYFNTLVYKIFPQDFDKLPGFNTTTLTTVALLGHFAIILTGKQLRMI